MSKKEESYLFKKPNSTDFLPKLENSLKDLLENVISIFDNKFIFSY